MLSGCDEHKIYLNSISAVQSCTRNLLLDFVNVRAQLCSFTSGAFLSLKRSRKKPRAFKNEKREKYIDEQVFETM